MADNKLTNLILTMGIRFWRTAVDILKIRDLHHCEDVLADLCRVLTISLKPFDLRQDSNLILSLGVNFWLETVREQNIRDVTHSEAVITYLQGFLDVINQDENVPENDRDDEKIIEYEDNTLKVIKFTKSDYELLKIEPGEEKDYTIQADHLEDHYSDNDYDDWKPPGSGLDQLCLPSPADLQKVKSEQILEEEVNSVKKPRCKKIKVRKSKKARVCTGGTRTVYCDYCGNKFLTAFRAAEHVDECHPEKKEEFDKKYLIYECVKPGCQKVFYIQTSLAKHYKKFHKDFKQSTSRNIVKPEKSAARCSECRRNFKILSNYEDHMEEHKQGLGTKLFQCDVCMAKFEFRTKLEKHIHKHDDLSLICPECGKSLPTKRKMYRHLELHKSQKRQAKAVNSKERECKICNQMVPAIKHQFHMFKFHDQDAEFCDICGKKFPSRNHLERHMNSVHSKEKNYLCSICCKKFATDCYLKRHMDSQHSSKFKYNCDQCGKGFSQKQTYEGHVNMHLGIKPYKCQGCGIGFQNLSNLLAHTKKSCKHLQ